MTTHVRSILMRGWINGLRGSGLKRRGASYGRHGRLMRRRSRRHAGRLDKRKRRVQPAGEVRVQA